MNNKHCPICKQWQESVPENYAPNGSNIGKVYDCLYCPKFAISEELDADREQYLKGNEEEASIIRYKLAMRSSDQLCFLTTENIAVYQTGEIPKPSVQLNNFILWLGRQMGNNSGNDVSIKSCEIIAYTGSINDESLRFVLEEASDHGLIQYQGLSLSGGAFSCQGKLTMEGWELYDELKVGSTESRQVFMAMQYGNQELDNIVKDVLKPAVRSAGYDLVRLDDDNPAGLIDDRLRIEIRKSKFLIADLSHGNKGAYWEAGFAEGLGKQVIYTCNKDVFDDEGQKPHFDANHHLTIVWDRNKINEAAEKLKACIRATFPEESIMED